MDEVQLSSSIADQYGSERGAEAAAAGVEHLLTLRRRLRVRQRPSSAGEEREGQEGSRDERDGGEKPAPADHERTLIHRRQPSRVTAPCRSGTVSSPDGC